MRPQFTTTRHYLGFWLVLCISSTTFAHNTGGVLGPVIDMGHEAIQWRTSLDPNTGQGATRVHYERAISDSLLPRIVAQFYTANDDAFQADYIQAELFWQHNETGRIITGLRGDLRLRNGDRPHLIGLNWMAQAAITATLSTRFSVIMNTDYGPDATQDITLGLRSQATYTLSAPLSIGLETYSTLGAVGETTVWDDQTHQVGPFITRKLTDNYSVFTGTLFGLTDANDATIFRFWLTWQP